MLRSVPVAPFTTIGLGGAARYFFTAGSVDEVLEALDYADSNRLRIQVLGGGSNIVFGDEGFDGLVLHIGLRGLQSTDDGEYTLVTAAAGEPWDEFVLRAIELGLGGIECLSGIPGSVGATPIQNVGAYGQEVSETIVSVRVLDRPSRTVVDIPGSDCAFGYRQSRFKSADAGRYIVLAVTFRLATNGRPSLRYEELRKHVGPTDPAAGGAAALGRVRDAVMALRRRKSMTVDPADPNTRSVGSFFTNPVLSCAEYELFAAHWLRAHPDSRIPGFPAGAGVKIPAGWLVENAGFTKGFRYKGVGISGNHALALVNRAGSAAELLELAGMIEKKVFETFSVRLEREPVIVR